MKKRLLTTQEFYLTVRDEPNAKMLLIRKGHEAIPITSKAFKIKELAELPTSVILGWIRMGWLHKETDETPMGKCVCTAACGAGLGHNKMVLS